MPPKIPNTPLTKEDLLLPDNLASNQSLLMRQLSEGAPAQDILTSLNALEALLSKEEQQALIRYFPPGQDE